MLQCSERQGQKRELLSKSCSGRLEDIDGGEGVGGLLFSQDGLGCEVRGLR